MPAHHLHHAMGYSTASGWRVNLEYTYINQDELRTGTGSTDIIVGAYYFAC
jgi:hypothetical protein